MAGFIGCVEHQVDEKNRIRIPKKYRDQIPKAEDIYFVRYASGCIAVLTGSALADRLQTLNGIRSDQPKLLKAKRAILSAIEEVEEDKQGRIVLSAAMRAHAGIKKDVITIGVGDYIEIWAAERYRASMEEMSFDEAYEMIAF